MSDSDTKRLYHIVILSDVQTAPGYPKHVVISESTEKKYFGLEDPAGKTLELLSDSYSLFTVAAVAEDAPANSSIQYNIVVPLLADADYAEPITRALI